MSEEKQTKIDVDNMTFEESIETTNIHSVSGMVTKENPLVVVRSLLRL